jgi:acyl dehydratase
MKGFEMISLAEYLTYSGKDLGYSQWLTVTQEMINQFADVTHDHQFIHIDPVRAVSEGPFGGTVAHGFLTLSLLSHFSGELAPQVAGTASVINYGLDKVRFLTPVHTGKRVRAKMVIREVIAKSGKEILTKADISIEIEGATKPALIAESLGLRVMV